MRPPTPRGMDSSSRSRSPFAFFLATSTSTDPLVPRYKEVMLPFINPTPILWFFLLFVGALLIAGVASFLGVLKGKDIEARPQDRSQKS